MNKKLFGTDGVRGIALETLTTSLAYKIGRSLPSLYDDSVDKIHIVVGRDTRLSSPLIENAVITGLIESGADVTKLGIVPSGAVAYLSKMLKANAGIMITASHNPPYYNGVKIFNGNGFKLTKNQELHIEKLVAEGNFKKVNQKALGQIKTFKKASACYEQYLIRNCASFFEGLSVVVDCANGAGGKIFPWVLKKCGARVKVINSSKNGAKINLNCGATNVKALGKAVLKNKFDLGMALDGDGDRLAIVDEKGKQVAGEQIIYLFAKYLKNKGLLKNNCIVTTVMSNEGLIDSIKKLGIKTIITPVGDENVIKAMIKNNITFGGETSGHYMFSNTVTTADGLLSSLHFLNLYKQLNMPLSKLNFVKFYPQKQINIEVPLNKKSSILKLEEVKETKKECEKLLKGKGRLLLRASGTENLIRLLVETKDLKLMELVVKNITQVIKNNL